MGIIVDSGRMTPAERFLYYVNHSHPLINEEALFADGTPYYRRFLWNAGECRAILRLRTGKNNVEQAQIMVDGQAQEMIRCRSDQMFDYYEAAVPCTAGGQRYYFKVTSGKMTVYYNKRGAMYEVQDYYSFVLEPEFKTPDWAKGAVIYQIFVDRFYNGDPSNDVVDDEYVYVKQHVRAVKDWDSLPAAMDVGRFYGGDLQGVIDKLDYLQDLGVEVLYLNPIFVSPSNHKYDIQDYDYVDPHFGRIVDDRGRVLDAGEMDNTHAQRYICRVTNRKNLEASNELFIRLVTEVHRRGMRIILDGVFNHCGSFNKWMDRERIYENQDGYEKGAFVDEHSPYHSFFKFSEKGSWPYNTEYDGWWGHDTLPKMNYEESAELEEYILQIARKWVSPPYNADGWRLDVAADLGHSQEYNHAFWKRFRKAVKSANPDALILAEHYGDPGEWLLGDEWDTVMNYDAFMEPVTWFLTGVEKHSDEYAPKMLGDQTCFNGAMSHHMSRYRYESLYVAMNELSNHDHSRFLTRTNRRVGRIATAGAEAASEDTDVSVMRLAVIIQMTWPGAPTIYYGDEAGVCGWTDPDSRRTYPWGHEDKEMIAFHKNIIRIHKECPVTRTGSLKNFGGAPFVLTYGRFDDKAQMAVAINAHETETKQITLPIWQIGVQEGEFMECLLCSDAKGYRLHTGKYKSKNGQMTLSLPPKSGFVLYHSSPLTQAALASSRNRASHPHTHAWKGSRKQ